MYTCAHVKVSSFLLTCGSRGKHLYQLNHPASLLILSTHSLLEIVQEVKNIVESQGKQKILPSESLWSRLREGQVKPPNIHEHVSAIDPFEQF